MTGPHYGAAIWEIPLPFCRIGGIYGGFFHCNGSSCNYSVLCICGWKYFIYRDLHIFRDIPRVMKRSMLLVGAILMILGCALGLMNFLIDQQFRSGYIEIVQAYVSSKINCSFWFKCISHHHWYDDGIFSAIVFCSNHFTYRCTILTLTCTSWHYLPNKSWTWISHAPNGAQFVSLQPSVREIDFPYFKGSNHCLSCLNFIALMVITYIPS